MNDRPPLTWRRSIRDGLIFTGIAGMVLELVGAAFGRVPDAAGILALIVVVCAFIRGPAGGLASAAIAVMFVVLEGWVGGRVFQQDDRWLVRTIMVAVTMPVLALLVGFLHKQTQHRLERERHARAEAEAAERRYRDLVEGLGAVVWQADVEDYRVQFVSRRAAELFGYPIADWLDSDQIWRKLIHPDDYDRVLAQRDDAARSTQPYEIEYRVITRAGHVQWMRSLVHLEMDAGGPRSLRGFMVDITERRHADEILRDDQQRYRQLLDHAADALFVHDASGKFVDVNQAACEALGHDRAALLNMRVEDVEVGFDGERSASAWRTLAQGRSLTQHVTYRRKDGTTFPVEVRVARLYWGGRQLMVALARDVSERVRLEEQTRQVQKMDAIGRLAGGVAHDFNNLLTTIRGHTELLLAEAPPEGQLRDDLLRVALAADRAATLTRQLLAFSRQQIFTPEILDAMAVVRDLEPIVARLITTDIQFEMRLRPTGVVRADRGQLEQVLINLVMNARDALRQGGRLTISTHLADINEAESVRLGVTPSRYAVIAIEDTGPGMDAETAARIFEPFFTTTRHHDHVDGLGLATAYGIVKQTGGHLIPESEPGKGTTFRVYLPIVQEALVPPNVAAGPDVSQAALAGNETVLLVEDEAEVRTLVARVLALHGYDVVEASDGEDAMAVVDGGRRIDLLLSDIVMPRMNGRELVRRLRAAHPDLKVLLMSGYSDEETVQRRELPKDTPFLAKPFAPDLLVARVRAVLDQSGVPI